MFLISCVLPKSSVAVSSNHLSGTGDHGKPRKKSGDQSPGHQIWVWKCTHICRTGDHGRPRETTGGHSPRATRFEFESALTCPTGDHGKLGETAVGHSPRATRFGFGTDCPPKKLYIKGLHAHHVILGTTVLRVARLHSHALACWLL